MCERIANRSPVGCLPWVGINLVVLIALVMASADAARGCDDCPIPGIENVCNAECEQEYNPCDPICVDTACNPQICPLQACDPGNDCPDSRACTDECWATDVCLRDPCHPACRYLQGTLCPCGDPCSDPAGCCPGRDLDYCNGQENSCDAEGSCVASTIPHITLHLLDTPVRPAYDARLEATLSEPPIADYNWGYLGEGPVGGWIRRGLTMYYFFDPELNASGQEMSVANCGVPQGPAMHVNAQGPYPSGIHQYFCHGAFFWNVEQCTTISLIRGVRPTLEGESSTTVSVANDCPSNSVSFTVVPQILGFQGMPSNIHEGESIALTFTISPAVPTFQRGQVGITFEVLPVNPNDPGPGLATFQETCPSQYLTVHLNPGESQSPLHLVGWHATDNQHKLKLRAAVAGGPLGPNPSQDYVIHEVEFGVLPAVDLVATFPAGQGTPTEAEEDMVAPLMWVNNNYDEQNHDQSGQLVGDNAMDWNGGSPIHRILSGDPQLVSATLHLHGQGTGHWWLQDVANPQSMYDPLLTPWYYYGPLRAYWWNGSAWQDVPTYVNPMPVTLPADIDLRIEALWNGGYWPVLPEPFCRPVDPPCAARVSAFLTTEPCPSLGSFTDTVYPMPVGVDLGVAGLADAVEDAPNGPGWYLGVNDNFDEGHDYEDWEDADPAHATSTQQNVQLRWDNMVELLVNLDPPNPGDMSVSPWLWASATVKLTGGRDNLRVFARNLECWNGGPEPPEGCWALIGPDDDLADECFGTFSPRPAWDPLPNVGWRFFVEGIAPGTAELTLEFQSGSFVASDKVKFTVVKIDADVDSDNTNGVAPYGPDAPAPTPPPTPPPSNAEDRIEEKPGEAGRFLMVNENNENDFAQIKFTAPNFTPHDPRYVKWSVTIPSNAVDIWQNLNKSGVNVPAESTVTFPWTDEFALPRTWYVEGLHVTPGGPVQIIAELLIDPDGAGTAHGYEVVHRDIVQVSVVRVAIDEPDGLPIQPIQSGDRYFRTAAPWCFEWQFVHANNEVVAYHQTQVIQGQVEPSPPRSCNWTVSAGTLQNPGTATPTYAPNNMPVPTTMASVDLDLHPASTAPGAYKQRMLEVYRDHLQRDRENFGTGISCAQNWTFARYGVTVPMPNSWNCHGSTRHHYDGTGTGSAGNLDFVVLTWTLKTEVQVNSGTHPPLGPLNRGDVVVYYATNGALMHSQTCTGNGTETYGANNEVVPAPGTPQEQSWRWSTCVAGDWANNVPSPWAPVTVKVFAKP
jgi:hypothetical protein